jgi:hypothetical protein
MRKRIYPLILLVSSPLNAADDPEPTGGDFVLRDFRFASGEVLPELRIHYHTLGAVQKDRHGVVRNAVLIPHGTTGSGASFLRPEFAGNPPELGILEREIRRVPKGKAVLVRRSDRARGHGTHTLAAIWKDHLIRLLHGTNRGDAGEGG